MMMNPKRLHPDFDDSRLATTTPWGQLALAFRHGARPGPWLRQPGRLVVPARQADASRRRSGPRKATSRRPITVRLRGKSCPAGGPDGLRNGRRGVVAGSAARPSAGGCGVEDQVGRAGAVTSAADTEREEALPWTFS
jgi:hypothetical protein